MADSKKKWLWSLPGWLFLSSGPLWRWLWRGVEFGGDIDFILSIAGRFPPMIDAARDWGWIPAMALGFAWLSAYRRASVAGSLPAVTITRVLALGAVAMLVVSAFLAGRAIPSIGSIAMLYAPIEKWSISSGGVSVTIASAPFLRWSDGYRMQVLCRAVDNTREFENSNLIASQVFGLSASPKSIRIPLSQPFINDLCSVPNPPGGFGCRVILVDKSDPNRQKMINQEVQKSTKGIVHCKARTS